MNEDQKIARLIDALREIAALAAAHAPPIDPVRETLAGVEIIATSALATFAGWPKPDRAVIRRHAEERAGIRATMDVATNFPLQLGDGDDSLPYRAVYVGGGQVGRVLEREEITDQLDGASVAHVVYRAQMLTPGGFQDCHRPTPALFDAVQAVVARHMANLAGSK